MVNSEDPSYPRGVIHAFLQCFVPLFFAFNFFSLIPLYLSFTEDLSSKEKHSLVNQACVTVLITGLLFLVAGHALFNFLGILEGDFKVGGGLILLTIAISDLAGSKPSERRRSPGDQIGVVPLGIPLIMGPAAMTTLLVVSDAVGYWPTVAGLIGNLVVVWFGLHNSKYVLRVIGQGGAKAIAKVASLFLSAIAIAMIRKGLSGLGII